MPTREPGEPQKLEPPKTRITQQWSLFWRSVTKDQPASLARARTWSTALRHLK